MRKTTQHWENKSEKREARIYRAFQILVGGITLLFIVGGVFTYLSIKDLKNNILDDMSIYKENLKAQIKSDLRNDLDVISEEIRKRINEEFDRKNIQLLVESVAKERIDKIADELIRSKVESVVTTKVAEINNKVENLFNKTELKLLYLEASNDSRPAFEKLKEFSLQSSYSYKDEAKMYYETIYAEYSSPVLYYPFLTADVKGIDLNKLKLDDIKELFKKVGKVSRSVIQNEIWFDKRFSFEQKMIFYKDIIKTDKSIQVTRKAAQIVINQNDLTYNPMEWDKILSFLESKFQ